MARSDSPDELELMHHVPQPDQREHQHITSLPPTSPLQSQHPSSFNFPMLEDDGSVSDLTTLRSPTLPQHSTPAAALSARGTRAVMADRGDASETDSSITDQYDIIDPDDLSEISNDDHETASIASNEHYQDDQLTPEHLVIGSDEDELVEHELSLPQATPQATERAGTDSSTHIRSRSPTESVVMVESSAARQTRAENELIDSYMSDDLETPRQSTLPFSPANPAVQSQIASKSIKIPRDAYRILFVSDRDQPLDDMDIIVERVIAAMQTRTLERASDTDCRVVRSPPTPRDITPASAKVLCDQENVIATIQHCTSATRQSFGYYALSILGHNGKHASWLVIGPDGQSDQHMPDLAILHIRNYRDGLLLEDVGKAVDAMKVPSMVVLEDEVPSNSKFREPGSRKVIIRATDFIRMDSSSLRNAVDKVMEKASSRNAEIARPQHASPTSRITGLMYLMLAALPIITLLINTILTHTPIAFDTSVRRETLMMSLGEVPGLDMANEDTDMIDLEHLLPALPAACFPKTLFDQLRTWDTSGCQVEARYQPVQPNHMIVSLPRSTHIPQVVALDVHKFNGHQVSFNTTELVGGVLLFTFDPKETYDTVTVSVVTEKPPHNITISHYYGKRLLQRKTYENAGTEVSKRVGSDLAVISKTAHEINEVLSTKVSASVQATRKFTSSLTKYMTRELQVVSRELQLMRKTASSMLPNQSVVNKDLAIIQKDLVKFTHGLSGSLKSTVESAKSSTKALVKAPLILSRERLHSLRKVLQDKKEDRKRARNAKRMVSEARTSGARLKKSLSKAKQPSQQKSDHRHKLDGRLSTTQQQGGVDTR